MFSRAASGPVSKRTEEKTASSANQAAAHDAAAPASKKLKTAAGGSKAGGKENAGAKNQSGARSVSALSACISSGAREINHARIGSGVGGCRLQQQLMLSVVARPRFARRVAGFYPIEGGQGQEEAGRFTGGVGG